MVGMASGKKRRAPVVEPAVVTHVPIAGMTCAACETRIARTLKKVPGVTAVTASHRLGRAEVTSAGEPDLEAIHKLVVKAGYRVGEDKRPWLSRDRAVWRDVVLAVAVVLVVVVAVRAMGMGSVGDAIAGRTEGNIVLFLALGIAASLSSCMALVGGIVLGLSARFAENHPGATVAQRVRPQLMFNLGRVVGFAGLGAVLGLVGRAVGVSGVGLGVLTLVVAVVMFLLGAKLTGISPRLGAAAFTLPSGVAKWLHRDGDVARPYRDVNALGLGVVSFFLPCGFTQAAQVAAAGSGSVVQGAVIMGLFAVGTTPGLMAVGTLSSLAQGKWAERVFRWIGVVVIGFAVFNVSNAVHVIAPSLFVDTSPVTEVARTSNVTDDGLTQVVHIEVDGRGYTPSKTVVYAGRPIRWEFELTGRTCAETVDGSNLGFGSLPLEMGVNTVTSTLAEPGRYQYSCWMGMFRSTVVAIEEAG
jgi:sulfite exporter TauE/SafE/copper chaperone CopZ